MYNQWQQCHLLCEDELYFREKSVEINGNQGILGPYVLIYFLATANWILQL